jgi:hypothetical protein
MPMMKSGESDPLRKIRAGNDEPMPANSVRGVDGAGIALTPQSAAICASRQIID